MAYPDNASGAAITAATDSRREVHIEPRALTSDELAVIAAARAVIDAVAAFKALPLVLNDRESRRHSDAADMQAVAADALDNDADDLRSLIVEIEAAPGREADAERQAIEDAAWMEAV